MEKGTADLDLREFCNFLAEHLPYSPEQFESCGPLIPGLGLDELSWALLINTIEILNPYFNLPEQANLLEMTTADLHHFYRTMDEHHIYIAERDQV